MPGVNQDEPLSAFFLAEDCLPCASIALPLTVESRHNQHDCAWAVGGSSAIRPLLPEILLDLEDLANVLAAPDPNFVSRIDGMDAENLVDGQRLQNGRQCFIEQQKMERAPNSQFPRLLKEVNISESVVTSDG